MIVRRLSVAGWRCFAEAVAVGPFGDGLNVVHGPNGVGKSTLLLALARGLCDSHRLTGAAVKALVPWGRELAPKVVIEFEQDEVLYRLTKQFCQPHAELARWEGGRFVPLAEDRRADEQVQQLLQFERPGKGASDRRHWGLAQVLWAEQTGGLALEALGGGAKALLQQALGAQLAGPETGTLEARLAAEYDRLFTAGGKLRTGASAPPLVGLRTQREAAQRRRQELADKLAAYDDAVRRIEDLRNVQQQAGQAEQGLERRLNEEHQRNERYRSLAQQCEQQQRVLEAAQARFRELDAQVKSVQAARQEVRLCREQLARLDDAGPPLTKELELRTAEETQARDQLDRQRARRDEVASARRRAALAQQWEQAAARQAAAERTLQQAAALAGQRAAVAQAREAVLAPDAKTLKAIAQAARQRDDARLRLEASLITLEITAETDLTAITLRAEAAEDGPLPAGRSLVRQGSPAVAVRLEGVATVRACGPAGSADELRGQWQQAQARLEQLTAGFGGADLEALQQAHQQAHELDRQRSDLEGRQETLLAGRSLEDLRQDLALAERQQAEALASEPAWREQTPSAAALAGEADRLERQGRQEEDAAAARHTQAARELSAVGLRIKEHETERRGVVQRLTAAERRLEELARDGLSDEDRDQRLTQLAIDCKAAEGALRAAQDQRRAFGDDPQPVVEVLMNQLVAAHKQAAEAAEKLHRSEEQLSLLLREAPYSALAAAEEALVRLDDELARQDLHVSAIRLLYDAHQRRKKAVVDSLVGPVRQRATQTLARIAGARFSAVEIDDQFAAAGVVPRSQGEAVLLDQLSGGEREQVFFAVRLALAEIACQGRRELVVLDDVFTFTDTARLARIVRILQEAAERFQIVLLTCHPERYQGLPGAQFFDLEQIASFSARPREDRPAPAEAVR